MAIWSKPVKCGQVSGTQLNVDMRIGASEVFKDLSGHFVKPDGSGRIELADATSNNILGWALQKERTASSTEGADWAVVNLAYDALYVMPACGAAGVAVTETQLKAAVGETCDLYVASNVQYANIAASDYDVVKVVDYIYVGSAVGQQFVVVQRFPLKDVGTGVA